MDSSAASFKFTRPPKGYHEINATIEGRRKLKYAISAITARMCGYPLNRSYKLETWRHHHGQSNGQSI